MSKEKVEEQSENIVKTGESEQPETTQKELVAHQDDLLVSPDQDLDEYVQVMMNLRLGARPILCW